MKDLAHALPLDGASRQGLAIASLCAAIAAIAAIGLLGVSGWFLTGAAIAGSGGAAAILAFNYLIPSALIRLLAIVRTITRYGERILSHKAALEAMASLRGSLFDKLAAVDTRKTAEISSGEAATRLIDDVAALEDLVIRQPARHAALVGAGVAVALSLLTGPAAALFLALALSALPVLASRLARSLTAVPAQGAAQALGDLRRRYVELAAARAEIAAYGLADSATAELNEPVRRFDAARKRLSQAEAMQGAVLSVYGALTVAGVLLLAKGQAPAVALAMLASAAAIEGMGGLSRSTLRRASLEMGMRRLATIQALDARSRDREIGAAAASVSIGSHRIAPRARLAIVGPSGSGKTRVLLALAGMGDPVVPLTLDETPVAACAAPQLAAQFALSPQDAPMLIGTVADNLRLARPGVTEGEMWDALDVAQLSHRVAAGGCGLDLVLGEGGGLLSGGERKRLSLSRAILANRPWLLLDEPTEGLDAATEATLIASLGAWLDRAGTGLILVSHRPAPLLLCDDRFDIQSLS